MVFEHVAFLIIGGVVGAQVAIVLYLEETRKLNVRADKLLTRRENRTQKCRYWGVECSLASQPTDDLEEVLGIAVDRTGE